LFKVLHPSVGEKITDLRDLLTGLYASNKIAQIEVAVGDEITVLIFRNLVELSPDDKNDFIEFGKNNPDLHIYLQPKGIDSITPLYPEKPANLFYSLPNEGLKIHFQPTDFTQIHRQINQKMLQQAMDLLDVQDNEYVLELFCGLGNFTLPIARRAKHVTAVEGDSELIKRANENANKYNIFNLSYIIANLFEETTNSWASNKYQKILLDPPRAGALEIIQQLNYTQTKSILYVSCNPATLARDAEALIKKGFKLTKIGVMDMFPQTSHIEAMALFTR
jgi:23S rRNA (uracil1939-C5)-methyltransferase